MAGAPPSDSFARRTAWPWCKRPKHGPVNPGFQGHPVAPGKQPGEGTRRVDRLLRVRRMRPKRRAVGIGQEPVAGIKGQARRLGLWMRAFCTQRVQRRDIELRQDVHQQIRRGARPVGRVFDQFDLAVGAGHGGQIPRPVGVADLAQAVDHIARNRALTEPRAPVPGDPAQDLGLDRGDRPGSFPPAPRDGGFHIPQL
jgi:hypothetical protein